MTCHAWSFTLVSRRTGGFLGGCLIAPTVRYASVLWVGEHRVSRRPVSETDWREINAELGAGLPPGPLPATYVMHAVLAGGRDGVVLQWLAGEAFTADQPEDTVRALDARLHTISGRSGRSPEPRPR